MMWFQQNKKSIFFLILLLIALTPLFLSLFHSGFFLTDDGNWMVIRLTAFYEVLRQGQFPVRFLLRLNNGYGYPVADFLYPLFLYIGSGIHLLHINFVDTVKVLFGLSFIASVFGSYLWLKNKISLGAGFIGALVYTLFPYHIWDMTKRGSLGEVVALGIVPFIFWQLDKKNIFFAGFFLSLLILAHNTLALLFLPIVVVYFILLRIYKEGILSMLIGIGISTFFWLPALFDKQFTVFDKVAVSHVSEYFLTNDLYNLIGIISFVIIILSLVQIVRKIELMSSLFLVITFISLSMTTVAAIFLWKLLPLGTYVQFPFRFLSITTLSISFLAAFLISRGSKKQQILLGTLFTILIFVSSWQYFFSKSYQYYPDTFYATNQDSTTVQNEYMPKDVQQLPAIHPSKVSIFQGTIQTIFDKGSRIELTTNSLGKAKIIIATVYFPGWKVFVDGKSVAVVPQPITGFIGFSVPKGEHRIVVTFTETPLRFFANMVSLVSIVILVAGTAFSMIRLKRKEK